MNRHWSLQWICQIFHLRSLNSLNYDLSKVKRCPLGTFFHRLFLHTVEIVFVSLVHVSKAFTLHSKLTRTRFQTFSFYQMEHEVKCVLGHLNAQPCEYRAQRRPSHTLRTDTNIHWFMMQHWVFLKVKKASLTGSTWRFWPPTKDRSSVS